VENVALTLTPLRTVEEVVVHMLADDGVRVELPVVVSERNPDRTLKAVRVYHSLWSLTGEHRMRPPQLPEDPSLHAEGAPGDYQRALAEGDLAGIVATFEPGGYLASPAAERTFTEARRACGRYTFTCSPTAVASRWSTVPSPTVVYGAPSSTTACAGG